MIRPDPGRSGPFRREIRHRCRISAIVTAAIFGLLGVIVGGVLNGAVAHWSERRKDRRLGVVAARLVRYELDFIYDELTAWDDAGYVPDERACATRCGTNIRSSSPAT